MWTSLVLHNRPVGRIGYRVSTDQWPQMFNTTSTTNNQWTGVFSFNTWTQWLCTVYVGVCMYILTIMEEYASTIGKFAIYIQLQNVPSIRINNVYRYLMKSAPHPWPAVSLDGLVIFSKMCSCRLSSLVLPGQLIVKRETLYLHLFLYQACLHSQYGLTNHTEWMYRKSWKSC